MKSEIILGLKIIHAGFVWLNQHNVKMEDLKERWDRNGGKFTDEDVKEVLAQTQKSVDSL